MKLFGGTYLIYGAVFSNHAFIRVDGTSLVTIDKYVNRITEFGANTIQSDTCLLTMDKTQTHIYECPVGCRHLHRIIQRLLFGESIRADR